ncbi:hypothetical protein F442_21830 [Phytophthora nicotianae P10297]|uniref:Uncharacterized protein n=1 Tax=Phytophthora nicotianae P10297 TaxID=1317064 RepID=W2Y1F0_PHYNI|nr:hypothetical protein F442_21830 [Phytophthora nicotianae P10297]
MSGQTCFLRDVVEAHNLAQKLNLAIRTVTNARRGVYNINCMRIR